MVSRPGIAASSVLTPTAWNYKSIFYI